MANIRRIFVEKEEEFAVEAGHLLKDLKENLGIHGLNGIRVLNRYDLEGLSEEDFAGTRDTVFVEPPVDNMYNEELPLASGQRLLAVEYLPGQYDQRADSAAQCVQIMTLRERPQIAAARVYVFSGEITDEEFQKIQAYLINPVDSRQASLEKPNSLTLDVKSPDNVPVLTGFIQNTVEELRALHRELGLAMDMDDLEFCRNYFENREKRDPTITEIKMLDTYWSDHCRHTTFETLLENIEIEPGIYSEPVAKAYEKYLQSHKEIYGQMDMDIRLMRIATITMKQMRKNGQLSDLEVSGEINACSIVRDVDVDGKKEEWLIMFKNETHNHPTEIEPFGGAATCLGGAIRDPLSGRSFVYQAMRVTGSGDPRTPMSETLPGKLPQRKISTEAAHGYSSYGNQIGLPTGQVVEIYHPGYVTKRMEVGAVVGAAPRANVIREEPQPGDMVILVGGKTGRDGIGGATGSSREHTEESIHTAGAEVQKGNPPEERKIQRLFRDPRVTRLIKRSNDFGAGGVAVAIGELAEGLDIDLDKVPRKYEGLDGTELALSESQERMAVVVDARDVDAFINFAAVENLEATVVAKITGHKRLTMKWRDRVIVDISREFIDTNGVRQKRDVFVKKPIEKENYFKNKTEVYKNKDIQIKKAWLDNLSELNHAGQQGLVERFDSTVGAGSVFLPFGGKYQQTPTDAMVARVPLLAGKTTTGTAMSFGFNPELASWSPFHGALYAVIEAVSKILAVGGDYRTIRTSLQEYFEKLGDDATRWGKPFSALLGAYYALTQLGIPAIGGKDSMSGSFKEMNVPPTLIAFAVTTLNVSHAVSQEFKAPGNPVIYVKLKRDAKEIPDFEELKKNYRAITGLIVRGLVRASAVVSGGGPALTLTRMAFGNRIGFEFAQKIDPEELFAPEIGSLLLELDCSLREIKQVAPELDFSLLGKTIEAATIRCNDIEISLDEAYTCWQKPLEDVFPTRTPIPSDKPRSDIFKNRNTARPRVSVARPRVLIPVFPGTNCEYETGAVFTRAGAKTEILVMRNLTSRDIAESIKALEDKINQSQILAFPGGFSAGDEPDGSGKFIAAVFRNPRVSEAVMNLLNQRDGLVLGICNGFQALIKLGLLPYGDIREMEEASPTLTFNRIGRHMSRMVQTQVTSVLSPWFSLCKPGDIHTIAISHSEGRFVAPTEVADRLFEKGQVATQYVDFAGNPSYETEFNPNGSLHAVEGITSPDGRVLGKMAHSERRGEHIAKNIPGHKDQSLFASGVNYFE